MKLLLKGKVKEWARNYFGDVGRGKENIVQEIQCLDKKGEIGQLSNDKKELTNEFERRPPKQAS